MRYGSLTNDQAVALMSARVELHCLRRNGCGGASDLACMTRLTLGIGLTVAAVMLGLYTVGETLWLVPVTLAGLAGTAAWVHRCEKRETAERVALLEQVFGASPAAGSQGMAS